MNVAEKDYWICFRTPESSQTTRRACRELLRGQPSSKGSAVSRDWSQTGKGPIDASHSGTVSFRLRRLFGPIVVFMAPAGYSNSSSRVCYDLVFLEAASLIVT